VNGGAGSTGEVAAAKVPPEAGAARLYAIDLHNHMPVPDADYRGPLDTSGDQVVAAALAAGVHALGVSDHFSLGFFRQARAAAQGTPLLVLPGTEVRLSFGPDEAHLVAIFPPDNAEALFAAFMDVIGFSEEARSGPLHRVVIECDPVRAAREIEELGGACVVAHVDRWFGDYRLLGRPLLRRIVREAPHVALEFVDAGNADLLDAGFDGVAVVQGSDSHATGEIGRRRTMIDAPALDFAAVRAALRRGATSAAEQASAL
jgi:hypothetical protein